MDKQLVLVVGPGFCGFQAVVDVLNLQPDVSITFEQLPALTWYKVPETALQEKLERFKRRSNHRIQGDAGFYYLPHLETLIKLEPKLKVVCLKRPREEFLQKFKYHLQNYYSLNINHWSQKPAYGITQDLYWSRCYPKYDLQDLDQCILRYFDEYLQTIETLAQKYPANIILVDAAESVETEPAMRYLLNFLQVNPENRKYATGRWKVGDVDPKYKRDRPPAPKPSQDPMDPRRCIILVPYNTYIHPQCDEALRELDRRGYPVRRVYGYAAVDQARNQLSSDALFDGFEETMWIDSDVGFHPDDITHLRQLNLPISSGIYPQKGKKAMASHILPGTTELTYGKNGGLVEILYAATGFLHIRREVYLKVMEHHQLPVCNERFGNPLIPYFQPLLHPIDDGTWYMAEDYAFSQRVRSAGFKIMADTRIRLWHHGMYAYGWEDAGRDIQRFENFTMKFDQQKKSDEK